MSVDSLIRSLSSGGPRRRGRPGTRIKKRQKYKPKALDSNMDDVHVFAPNPPSKEVLLGAYGVEEWFMSDLLRQRHTDGLSTIEKDITWLVPVTFELTDWVEANSDLYTFFDADRAIIQEKDGILKIYNGRNKLEIEFVGSPKWVRSWIEVIDASYDRAENMIEWIYDNQGNSISVPLSYRPAIKAAYPWLPNDLDQYIDDYLNSQASVLILLGPPGTGKTTFIKNLIHRSGGDAKVAYDEAVMKGDGIFAHFIADQSRALIMEDADNFLQSREEGNTMMHKFLNVSDGLISAADKKLIFSTNLPNVTDIDEALMRPGRCFDVVVFRPLTIAEAQVVIKEEPHAVIPEGKTSVTLAELFAVQPSTRPKKKRIGF